MGGDRVGHPVVGAGAARRRRQDGLWDRVNAERGEVHRPDHPGRDRHLQGPDRRGPVQREHQDRDLRGPGRRRCSPARPPWPCRSTRSSASCRRTADTAELNEKIGFFPISPDAATSARSSPTSRNALVAFKTGDAKREAAARQLLSYWLGDGYQDFVTDRRRPSRCRTACRRPADVPQALLDVHASLGDSVGSMQALAVANPDLYLNLADMIQGTKTPERGRRGDPGRSSPSSPRPSERPASDPTRRVPAAGAGTPSPEGTDR